MRFLTRTAAIVAALAITHSAANAQKKCTKGIPCGNSCIAANDLPPDNLIGFEGDDIANEAG